MEEQNQTYKFILVIFFTILYLIILNINYQQYNEDYVVEAINISRQNILLEPPIIMKIGETFERRKFIYQRSCSMINKLISLNKKGFINWKFDTTQNDSLSSITNYFSHHKIWINAVFRASTSNKRSLIHFIGHRLWIKDYIRSSNYLMRLFDDSYDSLN